MPDPLAQYMPRLPRLPRLRKFAEGDEQEEMSPEEEHSLLRTGISTLQYLGETLDKPGAAARGLIQGALGGQGVQAGPQALLNLIPFSDTLGLTKPEERTSPDELYETLGGPANEPGFDVHDIGRFGLGVVTDPLLYATGPLGTLRGPARAAEAALKAGRATGTAADVAGEATRALGQTLGTTALTGKILPRTGVNLAKQFSEGERALLGWHIPFTDLGGAITPLGGITDPYIGKAINKLYYGKYVGKPMQGLRYLMSENIEGKTAPFGQVGELHKALDVAWGRKKIAEQAMDDLRPRFVAGFDRFLGEFKNIAEHHDLNGESEVAKQFFVKMMEFKGGMPDLDRGLGMFKESIGLPKTASLGQVQGAAESMVGEFQKMMGEIETVQNTLYGELDKLGGGGGELVDILKRHLGRRPAVDTQAALAAGEKTIQNSLRAGSREYDPKRMEDIFRDLPGDKNAVTMDATFKADAEGLRNALAEANDKIDYTTIHSVRGLRGQLVIEKYIKPGLDKMVADDVYYASDRTAAWDSWMERPLKLNKAGKEVLDAAGNPVHKLSKYNEVLANWTTKPLVKRGDNFVAGYSRAEKLGNYVADLPEEIHSTGVFNRAPVDDVFDQLRYFVRNYGTLTSAHTLLKNSDLVSATAGGMPLVEAWTKAGFKKKGLLASFSEDQIATLKVQPGVEHVLESMNTLTKPAEAGAIGRNLDKINNLYRGALFTNVANLASHTRNWMTGIWQAPNGGKVNLGETIVGHLDLAKGLTGKLTEETAPWFKELGSFGILEGAAHRLSDVGQSAVSMGKEAPKGFWEQTTLWPFVYRGDPFYKPGGKQSILALAGEKLYEKVEQMNRGGYYFALRRKGYSPGQAKYLVDMNQFDYQAVSPFTKTVLRRLALFPTWPIKNIPYQFKMLFERPGGWGAQTIRAATSALGEDAGRSEYAPSWLKEGMAIRNPFGPGTPEAANYITQTGLPIEDINRYLPLVGGHADIGRLVQKATGMLSPPLLAPLETYVLKKQLWSDRNIKDLWSPTEALFGKPIGVVDAALAYGPATRYVKEATTMLDPYLGRKTVGQMAANLATGVRTTTVDIDKWKMLDLKKAIEKEELVDNPMVYQDPYFGLYEQYKGTPEGNRIQGRIRMANRMGQRLSKYTKAMKAKKQAAAQVGG